MMNLSGDELQRILNSAGTDTRGEIRKPARSGRRRKASKRRDHEHKEQTDLFRLAQFHEGAHPELALLFAIPNGGQRHVLVAKKLKDEGVKAGVPDIMLPVARGEHHGFFGEMKVGKNTTTGKQDLWIERLQDQGYCCVVAYSAEEMMEALLDYLGL
jgi:hypothetical protein